jgi:uncharacterized protein (DUF1697 family)
MSPDSGDRYVALLRGINVGTAKQVAMADLKALFEALGYADVKTHLRSGQAVLTADDKAAASMATDIEDAITRTLGMSVSVVIRSRAELAAVIKANRLVTPDRDLSRLFCVFLSEPIKAADLSAMEPATYEPDQFVLARGGREIFLWLPDGMGTSKLGVVRWDRVTGHKGLVATARNWRTTLKLLELLDA